MECRALTQGVPALWPSCRWAAAARAEGAVWGKAAEWPNTFWWVRTCMHSGCLWTSVTVMGSGASLCISYVCQNEFYVFHLKSFPNLSLYCCLELQHLCVRKFENGSVNIRWKLLIVRFCCVAVMGVVGLEEAVYDRSSFPSSSGPTSTTTEQRVRSPPREGRRQGKAVLLRWRRLCFIPSIRAYAKPPVLQCVFKKDFQCLFKGCKWQ